MNKNTNKFTFDSRIDYALILPAFMLILIGLYALYVAVSHDYPNRTTQMVGQQGTWVLVGMIIGLVVMHFDSRWLWRLTPILYVGGLVVMAMSRFLYSQAMVESTGAYNWLAIGGHNLFQPAEFMKIAYILFLARIIVAFQDKLKTRYLKDDFRLIGQLLLATLPVAVISVFLKDFGTFLVFVMIFGGMVLVSGVSWKIIAPALGVVAALGGAVVAMVENPLGQKILTSLLHQYQLHRFMAWLHPFSYTQSFSLQQSQSLISIGTGGLMGKGLDVASVHVPVRESDMIFTIIAEDFGFVGSALVILLYFFLIYRMIHVTFHSNNQYYTYISTGIIMMILFHVFENIGAAIGLVPLTGIPLPFISQGGSALMSNMIGLALVLSMKYNQLPDFVEAREQGKLSNQKGLPPRKTRKRTLSK